MNLSIIDFVINMKTITKLIKINLFGNLVCNFKKDHVIVELNQMFV